MFPSNDCSSGLFTETVRGEMWWGSEVVISLAVGRPQSSQVCRGVWGARCVLIYPWHHRTAPRYLRPQTSVQTHKLSQLCSSYSSSSVDIIGVLPALQCWTDTTLTIITGRGASFVLCRLVIFLPRPGLISRQYRDQSTEYTTHTPALSTLASFPSLSLAQSQWQAWTLTCLSDTW